ncbi:MAG: hypothetical protein ACI8TF_001121 [Paracoccaceae bacterium]|jgi:hypothetical protein
MALSYKTRRSLSLVLLLVGLPAYIATAWFIMSLFDRPPIWLELLVYIALGVIWAFPFKAVFRGIGQADPDAAPDDAP